MSEQCACRTDDFIPAPRANRKLCEARANRPESLYEIGCKQIGWADILETNSGEKSRTVTITGADGTNIVHSRQLPDRPVC
jgi:hypothetical protein